MVKIIKIIVMLQKMDEMLYRLSEFDHTDINNEHANFVLVHVYISFLHLIPIIPRVTYKHAFATFGKT